MLAGLLKVRLYRKTFLGYRLGEGGFCDAAPVLWPCLEPKESRIHSSTAPKNPHHGCPLLRGVSQFIRNEGQHITGISAHTC